MQFTAALFSGCRPQRQIGEGLNYNMYAKKSPFPQILSCPLSEYGL